MCNLKFDTSNCRLKSDEVAVSLISTPIIPNYGVSLYTDKKSNKWVRINVYKHDFLLAIKNFVDEGKTRFNYQEALNATKKYGWTTPSKEEWNLVSAYREEINEIIKEAGGEKLEDHWYWSRTVAQHYIYHAWLYHGRNSMLGGSYKSSVHPVRALAYPD